jgi:hypothetical protein
MPKSEDAHHVIENVLNGFYGEFKTCLRTGHKNEDIAGGNSSHVSFSTVQGRDKFICLVIDAARSQIVYLPAVR